MMGYFLLETGLRMRMPVGDKNQLYFTRPWASCRWCSHRPWGSAWGCSGRRTEPGPVYFFAAGSFLLA